MIYGGVVPPLLLLLPLLLTQAFATFIVVSPDDRQCMVIEKPKDTDVYFRHRFRGPAAGAEEGEEVGLTISAAEVLVPVDAGNSGLVKPVRQRIPVAKREGTFVYTVKVDGTYNFCLQMITGRPTAMDVAIDFAKSEEQYQQVADDQGLDAISLALLKLNDRIAAILNEADFMKTKEMVFHKVSESMNAAALWWPAMQMLILLCTGLYQVRHLTRFFKKKRLV